MKLKSRTELTRDLESALGELRTQEREHESRWQDAQRECNNLRNQIHACYRKIEEIAELADGCAEILKTQPGKVARLIGIGIATERKRITSRE